MKDISSLKPDDVAVEEGCMLSPPHPYHVDYTNGCHPGPSDHHRFDHRLNSPPNRFPSSSSSSLPVCSPTPTQLFVDTSRHSPQSKQSGGSSSSPGVERVLSFSRQGPTQESPSGSFYPSGKPGSPLSAANSYYLSPHKVEPESPGALYPFSFPAPSVQPEFSSTGPYFPAPSVQKTSPTGPHFPKSSMQQECSSARRYFPASFPSSAVQENSSPGRHFAAATAQEIPSPGHYYPASSVHSGAASPSASYRPSVSSGHVPTPTPTSTSTLTPSALSRVSAFMSSHSMESTPSPSASFASSPLSAVTSPHAPSTTTFTLSPLSPDTSSPLASPVTIKQEVMSPCNGSSPSHSHDQPPRLILAGEEEESEASLEAAQLLKPGSVRAASPGKTSSGSLLPPCKICCDKASGFHYGLNTCEACKGFFRRSLKKGVVLHCSRKGNCDVTHERRNMCGYCRYQKCLRLGMSKTAIKTGRYTHAKRTKDTLEIKRLMGEEPQPVPQEEDIDFEAVIDEVVKAHDDFVISSNREDPVIIRQKQLAKVEEVNLHRNYFGQMNEVSFDEHKEVFEATGLDVDNRRDLMNFHVKNSERWIRGYISFAKKLPGFRDLTLSDQANLVKYARIEFWFLGSYPGYNSELGVAVMPNGRCFTRREMCNVWKDKYIDVSFDLAGRLQRLQVTPTEIIFVKAICLTAGDRCSFDEPDKVWGIQWRMIRCLQFLLKQRLSTHRQFVSVFSNVFMCLTDLRDLNEAEFQTIQNTQLYELFTAHPLIMEMLPY